MNDQARIVQCTMKYYKVIKREVKCEMERIGEISFSKARVSITNVFKSHLYKNM